MIFKILKRLFIYLIFVIPAFFTLSSNKKTIEKFYLIDNTFDETMFMKDIKELSGFKKKLPKKRTEWIYKLTAAVTSYKSHFRTVNVIKRNYKYEAIFTTKKGEIFYFSDGRLLLPEDMTNDKIYRSYFYKYPLGTKSISKPKKIEFPVPVNFAFFDSLYGIYPDERENNLEIFYSLNRKLRFQNLQNASSNLKKVFKEIERAATKDYEVRNWVNNIQYVYTYINRDVRNIKSQSLHSYGIAIDILPYNRSKYLYWYWVEEFKKDWWNVKEEEKVKVPNKVVEIFENYGFLWGGKWFFFDIMHFEYRPELIKYAQLLRDDPLNKSVEINKKE
ncbi:MAG: M15 family metallopeptidase [Spirochaetes bacterium]|nr:M15 family metallopeptidase [Spirochaetota bacterium]